MRRGAMVLALAGLSGLALACRGTAPRADDPAWVSVRVPAEPAVRVGAVVVTPPASRVETTGSGLAVLTTRQRLASTVVVAPGMCPARVELGDDGAAVATLRPWLDVAPFVAPVGFGVETTLEVEPGCDAARQTPVTWEVVEGEPGGPLVLGDRGRTVKLRMPMRPKGLDAGWGIVPVSAAGQGRVVLRASFEDGASNRVERRVTVTAVARATGLPSAAVGQRLLLGGEGWRVTRAPEGGGAQVAVAQGDVSFSPDAPGVWHLEDGAGRPLTLSAGRRDGVPLDCTRSDCHADVGRAPASPMTTVFQRGLTGALGPDHDPRCAFGCHTTGEPGLDDGGFTSVLADFGGKLPAGERAWEALPRALRRLGGVGCVACHGPATIPEPSARWAILRSDVCATCHDLPPEYGHVAAWKQSRMARSDAAPETREAPCARCHTAAGFLASLGGKPRELPPHAPAMGIACAACHDVHEHGEGRATSAAAPALLRDTTTPEWMTAPTLSAALSERSGRLCIGCHAPSPERLDASATAAALWAGSGGLEPETGEALSGEAPHGAVQGGCLGCHRRGPAPAPRRGGSHAFEVDRGRCGGCHAPKQADPEVRARAQRLLEAAGVRRHGVQAAPALDASTPRARAIYDARLVAEDPAAAWHNASYARALLDAAERVLDGGGAP